MPKQTKINAIVNRILKRKYDLLKIDYCEIGKLFHYKWIFSECWKKRQGYAHDKKRIAFREDPAQLATVKHTLSACNYCHGIIENNESLTDIIFLILRGNIKEPKVKIQNKTKKKLKSKKPSWMRPHECCHCRRVVTGLLCFSCGHLSVKEKK